MRGMRGVQNVAANGLAVNDKVCLMDSMGNSSGSPLCPRGRILRQMAGESGTPLGSDAAADMLNCRNSSPGHVHFRGPYRRLIDVYGECRIEGRHSIGHSQRAGGVCKRRDWDPGGQEVTSLPSPGPSRGGEQSLE